MIAIQNINKTYKAGSHRVKAVDNVSLLIEKGDFVSILGHSGSGKTTLLSLIGGLTKPDSGTVVIDDTDIWAINDNDLSELRNREINFIYQFSSLIPTLTVMDNILLPTAFGGKGGREDHRGHALSLLEMVGLSDKEEMYPSQLSGGQQRRVAIARAFINRPRIVLADEPTGDLDEETEAEIIDLFRRMNEKEGVTFVIVTHNSDLARQTQKQYRMTNGVLKEA